MKEIIYEDKEQAKSACAKYLEAMFELQTRFGVWEDNEDSCTTTYTYARYRDESGKVMNYCHG